MSDVLSAEEASALTARLYAALKHEKGCSCGKCSGGLNAVDALARSHEQLRAQRDEINEVLTGLTRIGLTEPEDHVFRFFQRLHGLPETGGPSGPTWKARAVAAEAAARAGGCAADLAESWELSAERALARRLPEGDMVAERGKAAVFRTCARELRESVAVSGQTAEKEEA